VCTCIGFCLWDKGRNGCLCSSAQQFCTSSCQRARGTASLWMNTKCVAGRFFQKWWGIIVKILSAFRSLFRNDFHYSVTDCIIGIKIPFSNWRLKSSNSRLIWNNECWLGCYLHKQKFTREIRNCWRLLVSIGLTLQGIFLNFQEHFLCIYSRLVFKKLFFTVL